MIDPWKGYKKSVVQKVQKVKSTYHDNTSITKLKNNSQNNKYDTWVSEFSSVLFKIVFFLQNIYLHTNYITIKHTPYVWTNYLNKKYEYNCRLY